MSKEDLKTKTPDELKKLLLDSRKEQFNQRFQRTNGQLENTAVIRKVRRNIARIKTLLNQKSTQEAAPAKVKKTPVKAKKAAA